MEVTHFDCYLSLGSNIGDKLANLNKAIREIESRIGKIKTVSSIYETEPWGYESDNQYFNCVVLVATQLSATKLLKETQEIEKELGRLKTQHYTDRTIDIDILLIDNLIINEDNLQIPHPHITKRDFVLYPLAEINPHLVINKHFLTIEQAQKNLNKTLISKLIGIKLELL
ncbi:MAG TPA: 2-amino-4-hydroxy-6-hydroxymethyldihydropteridine diphosphokinase [Taishania sp.]|nr:2-amino-4-hydroxy-6-hydroxymethyldihydropteridine diphosphokinase [Taishania sp.]